MGAQVDGIAAKTQTSKRMIYYYFRDKEGVFTAVLEREYLRIRAQERALDVERLDPEAGMRKLVGATFDDHLSHEIFIRLVMVENIHRAEHLRTTSIAHSFGHGVLDQIERIYRRGVAEGIFRDEAAAIDIHLTISALAFHYMANRGAFSLIFDHDMTSPEAIERRRGLWWIRCCARCGDSQAITGLAAVPSRPALTLQRSGGLSRPFRSNALRGSAWLVLSLSKDSGGGKWDTLTIKSMLYTLISF